MDERAEPQNKEEWLAALGEGWQALEGALDGMDQRTRERRDAAGWNGADHLSHLAVWVRGVAALLRKENRYEAMGLERDLFLSGDYDRINDVLHRQHGGKGWDAARDDLARAHNELVTAMGALDDDELRQGYAYFQPDEDAGGSDRPVTDWIAGNSFGHYAEHLGWLR